MEYLILYQWPGNVRQLANEIRRMVALAESGAVLMPEHLSQRIAASRRTIPASERDLAPTEFVVRARSADVRRASNTSSASMIQYALKLTGGKLEEAAQRLGLSRKGLYLKRQRLGLSEPDEPEPAASQPTPTRRRSLSDPERRSPGTVHRFEPDPEILRPPPGAVPRHLARIHLLHFRESEPHQIVILRERRHIGLQEHQHADQARQARRCARRRSAGCRLRGRTTASRCSRRRCSARRSSCP